MSRPFVTVVMLLALVLTDAFSYCSAAGPAADLRVARIESVLESHRLHGYASPMIAAKELQDAVNEFDGSEPLELQVRFHATLAELALSGRDVALVRSSVEELEKLAGANSDAHSQATALILRAREALAANELATVPTLLEQAGQLAEDDPHARLRLLQAQMRHEEASGLLTAALATALEAVSLAESLGNVTDQTKLMHYVARMNTMLGNYQRALAVLKDAQLIARSIGFIDAQANIYLDEGHIHALAGDRAKQLAALRNALSIAEADPGLRDVEVITLSNMADYYLSLPDFQRALEFADRASSLAETMDSVNGRIVATANQGLAMVGLGAVADGVTRLEQALQMSRTAGHLIYEVGIAAELARVLEQDGQHQRALQTMHQVADLNAKITRQEREKAVLELQEKYDNERKDREIERLSAQAELKKAEIDVRSWRQRLWAAVAFALGLSALLMGQWLKRSKAANRRLSLDNANLVEQNVIDALTGAFNRRYFHALVEQAAASQPHGQGVRAVDCEVGMMLLDIDHFKVVNDTHGHATGDEVLVQIVHRLKVLLRDSDAVVRWGGEEFVLVLPGTLATGLQTLAARILNDIANRPFATSAGPLSITVSLGCVAFPSSAETQWEDAIKLADAGMYHAKQNGRNRAVCVQRIGSNTELYAVHEDLAKAENEGKIRLRTILGERKEVAPA